jgi:LysR family glycine cleavage system transcriptional activator
LSFTKSARELHVTQTAVSHQVKTLEQYLGCRLFERKTRALALTDAGRALLAASSAAFAGIADATERITSGQVRRTLKVSVLPSLAARWLLPRLGRFRTAQPDVELHLLPSSELADVARGEADIGIRWGRGHYPGLTVHRLLGDELFPACRPALLRGASRLRSPQDLARHPLLHDENDDDWQAWQAAAGIAPTRHPHGIYFSDASLLIQAAVDGLGVGLVRRVLVEAELRKGSLVRPFPIAIPARNAYFLVYQPARTEEPKIRAFRDWISGEVGRSVR